MLIDNLKNFFNGYKAGNKTAKEVSDLIDYNIAKCRETLKSLEEKVSSSLWDVSDSRNKSQQLLTQLEVKLQEFKNKFETAENYNKELENLFEQYKQCEFAAQIDFNNMSTPAFLDVNLWIRKGKIMTPLNDMIWRPTKRYDEGDIVMTFIDGIFFANVDYESDAYGYWKFKTKGFDQLQGIDLRPVYFMCNKGCINEHPFNSKMGQCLVRNSINYYAVEITSIIKINNSVAFSTRWFNNKEYWEPITDLRVLGLFTGANTYVPNGNFIGSTNFIQNDLPYGNSTQGYSSWPVSVGYDINVSLTIRTHTYTYALGTMSSVVCLANSGVSTFPHYKTTTETKFEAAYANWTK